MSDSVASPDFFNAVLAVENDSARPSSEAPAPPDEPRKSCSKAGKIVRNIILVLVGLVVAVLLVVFVIWHNEILTLMSFKQVSAADDSHSDGAVYQISVSGDYYFEDFLAQGGASNDSELISFITQNITKGLIPMSIEESAISCASFTATTAEGDVVFGRNYDFSKTNTCIVFTNPGGGRHASVSTVDLQFIGIDADSGVSGLMDYLNLLAVAFVPLDGINDAGVACGIYMSYQGEETVATDQQTEKPDLTSTTMLRLVLDYADDLDEAIELISTYDLHDSANTSFHYMIADATGRSAILEWVNATDTTDNDGSARVLKITYSDGEPYQVVTNFIVEPGYYDTESEDDIPGYDRYEYLTEALDSTAGLIEDEQVALDLLEAVGRRTWKPGSAITVHSVVYNLTDLSAIWVGNEHFGEDSYTFYLELSS